MKGSAKEILKKAVYGVIIIVFVFVVGGAAGHGFAYGIKNHMPDIKVNCNFDLVD